MKNLIELVLILKLSPMKKMMLNTGIFSVIFFAIGAIFKMMHWPGAGPLLILPILSMIFIFLPMLYFVKAKEIKEGKRKKSLAAAILLGVFVALSGLFDILHWPWAYQLWVISLGFLFFVFVPVHFFEGVRTVETKTNTIISSVLILMAGGLVFTMTNFSTSKLKNVELSIELNEEVINSKELLIDIERIPSSILTDTLHFKCKKVLDAVQELKEGLLASFSGQKMKIKQEKNLLQIYRNDEFRTSYYLFEDNANRELINLKNELGTLSNILLTDYNIRTSDLLNTKNRNDFGSNSEEIVTWEVAYFHQVKLQIVLALLNQIALETTIIDSSFN
jgi:hypothetical protein